MISGLTQWWTDFMSKGDPKLAHLPFMGGPLPILSIVCGYVYLVKVAGPRFMANREAFEIKKLILCYNFTMILISSYLFISGGIYGWFKDYSYTCQPPDYSNSKNAVGMAITAYLYFLTKIFELLDTVFFVARKKFNQVTLLHVTHHATLAWTMYWGVKYYPTGHGSFGPFFNCFVHIVMYTYYFLAALGPSVRKYLWWKKYITQLQLAQFGIVFIHASQVFWRPNCSFPKGVMLLFLAVVIYFIVMFVDFYHKEYVDKKNKTELSAIKVTETDPKTFHGYNYFSKKEKSTMDEIATRMRQGPEDDSRHLDGPTSYRRSIMRSGSDHE